VKKLLWIVLASTGYCYGQQLSPNAVLPATTLASGSTLYQAQYSITNGASFVVQASASVTFKAGSYIHLEPGFHATASSAAIVFHALIDPSLQSVSGGTVTSQPPTAANPSKEYIYLGGRVVAIENPH